MNANVRSAFLVTLVSLMVLGMSQGYTDKYQKLIKTAAEKKSGIAEFTGDSVRRYAKNERDFSLIVLLTTEKTTKQVQCDMCPTINKEYARMVDQFRDSLGEEGFSSKKFLEKPVFFGRCDIVSCLDFYKEGNYQQFPLMLHLRPSNKNNTEIEWRQIDRVDIYQDPTAENMVAQVSKLTGNSFVRVTPVYKKVITLIGVVGVIALIIKLVYDQYKDYFKNPMVWFAVSLVVYAGVMAGTVFNSIHNPGLYYMHPQTQQIMLIYPSSRHQFILEGLIMAALFIVGAIFFIAFTSHVPTFKNPWRQRGMFAVCALGCYTCWYWTMVIFKVKHPYYPYWK